MCVPKCLLSRVVITQHGLGQITGSNTVTVQQLGAAIYMCVERWGAGVEYHFQESNEPYAPS